MKWASALAGNDLPGKRKYGGARQLLTECAESINFQLSNAQPDLVIGFVSSDFMNEFDEIPALVKKHLGAKHFIGCSAGGLIGGGYEVEKEKLNNFTLRTQIYLISTQHHLPGKKLSAWTAVPRLTSFCFPIRSASKLIC
jgi:small ligand-binding sensory domain FIST